MKERMCSELKTCASGQVKADAVCVCVCVVVREIPAESRATAPCTAEEPPAASFHPPGREGRRDKAAFP